MQLMRPPFEKLTLTKKARHSTPPILRKDVRDSSRVVGQIENHIMIESKMLTSEV